jgi:hypothetical protein
MEKTSLLESLKTLASQEDVLAVAREISELRNKFEDVTIEEDRQFQVKQLDAQEAGEEVLEKPNDPIRQEFYEVYSEYRERKNTAQKAKSDIEEANLRRKKALIERMREVVEKEENIGSAMASFKEIQELWKEAGEVPRDKRQDIQSEYSRLIETFFYHIKIYRELRDHDFHRNYQLKLDIIKRIQALDKVDQIKDVEQAIRNLQHEWDETGPVNNDEWENLKNTYWENVKAVYARIQVFYDERRNELTENLAKKQAIAVLAEQLVNSLEASSTKDWEAATANLIALQEEWKTIGFGPRKENEDTWKEFRGHCDTFFQKKKAFFDSIRGQFDEITEKKQKLIAQLETLCHSTEWKDTTEKIVKIQNEWKTLGSAGQRQEQKLWKEFRAHCDFFFNAKQAFYAKQDEELAGNLILKNELIEKIKSTPLPEDKREALNILKQYSAEFNEIGKVPMKHKDSIFNAYRSALNSHYEKLKLEGEEQEKMMFQARLDTLKSSPNSEKALSRERADLVDKLNRLKADILQYENNLGFFSKSKGADALRKEVESKIAASNRKIDELKRKIAALKQA